MMTSASVPLRAAESLPRHQRIAKRRDFLRAYENGNKAFGRHAIVFALPNGLGYPRIGVTTTRKLGGAVVRNRLKRWVREVFRLERHRLGLDSSAIDFVVNPRRSALDIPWKDFRSDLTRTMDKAARGASRVARGE